LEVFSCRPCLVVEKPQKRFAQFVHFDNLSKNRKKPLKKEAKYDKMKMYSACPAD